MTKLRILSEQDSKEILEFEAYLNDIGKLTPQEFVAKWKDYMELSDEEVKAYANFTDWKRGRTDGGKRGV